MVLNWDTIHALPSLMNYHEAKAHYDSVTPIRGCSYKARPVGRRDQKWYGIWEDPADGAIHIGYNCRREPQKQISFYRNGGISVWQTGTSASDNERLSCILGANFETHQYCTWVQSNYYEEGELKRGWMPLAKPIPKESGSPYWDRNPGESKFVRGADNNLIYLNYKYPVTHKPNKAALAEHLEPLKPFIMKAQNIIKLQGGRLEISTETRVELFGWRKQPDYRGNPVTNPPPQLRNAMNEELAQNREIFFGWCKSEDPVDHMRALATLESTVYRTSWKPTEVRQWFINELLSMHGEAVMEAITHKDGKMVRDKYRRFLGNPYFV